MALNGLSNRIRRARRLAGISQEKLAHHLGLHRTSVAQWERDASRPNTGNLVNIALFTGVSMEWLATGRGDCPEAGSEDADHRHAAYASDELEERLLHAFRLHRFCARQPLVEFIEQSAAKG